MKTNILCAWSVAPETVWIQTRCPKHARKLSRRGDSKNVAIAVTGGFLRIFEFQKGFAWAQKLIARYQSGEKVTNEAKFVLNASLSADLEINGVGEGQSTPQAIRKLQNA